LDTKLKKVAAMEEHKNLIVVPWDFTPVAAYALAHAVKIRRHVGNDIAILHIVDEAISSKDLADKKAQLQKIAEENSTKYNVPLTWHINKGSIFHEIAEFVNEKEAGLVIMGTHGMKGMQKFTGSWALKVMSKSRTPFIVVQSPPQDDEKYQSIVFPVDFRGENKEKMKMAIFMGKYFDSKIHMLVLVPSDKGLAKKTRANLNFAVKYLIQNNIEYEIHEVPKKRFAEQVLEFSHKIKADLILIVTTKNISFADYAFGASEQFIIANSEKIPVVCVIPKVSFMKLGQFMGGWGD
jgi:nucleotide-binding universal stress UspA family protein